MFLVSWSTDNTRLQNLQTVTRYRDKKSDLLCASYAVRLKCEYSLICMKVKVLVNG